MLRLLLALPFWAYFLAAVGVFYLGDVAEKDWQRQQEEKAAALAAGPPELIDLSSFRRDTHVGLADEVNVRGWIDTDLNYTLVKKRNGITTGERYMYVLFGEGDPDGARTARAAMVMTEVNRDRFAEAIETYVVGVHDGGLVVAINGRASGSTGFSDVARDALEKEGVSQGADFVYLSPFLDGRAVALAPPTGSSGSVKGDLQGIAAVLAFFGLARMIGRRGRNKAAALQTKGGTGPSSLRDNSGKGMKIDTSARSGEGPGERFARLQAEIRAQNQRPDEEPIEVVPTQHPDLSTARAAERKHARRGYGAKDARRRVLILAVAVALIALATTKLGGLVLPLVMLGLFWGAVYFVFSRIRRLVCRFRPTRATS